MIKRKHIAGVLTLGAVLTSSALAQADPVRPTPQEVSASGGQMCAIINQNASQDGVIAAVVVWAPTGPHRPNRGVHHVPLDHLRVPAARAVGVRDLQPAVAGRV